MGALLAAHSAEAAIGAVIIGRWCPPAWRPRLIGPMAIAATALLLGFAVRPELVMALGLLTVSGIFGLTKRLNGIIVSIGAAYPTHGDTRRGNPGS